MPSSGRPIEVTVPAGAGGQLTVTCTFDADGIGSDWGSGAVVRAFMEQGGVTTYDGERKLGTARQNYSVLGRFTVAPGAPAVCGVFCQVSGASSRAFYDLVLRAELVKR